MRARLVITTDEKIMNLTELEFRIKKRWNDQKVRIIMSLPLPVNSVLGSFTRPTMK